MKPYNYWLIEPRDTVLFRDARPFVGSAGASTLPFPHPSTFAGFVRTRLGMNPKGQFEWTPEEARQIRVAGPWLVELEPYSNTVREHYMPAPADIVLFREEGSHEKTFVGRKLTSRERTEDEWCDLPDSCHLVDFAKPLDENPVKPARGPQFWSATRLRKWLNAPQDIQPDLTLDQLGLECLPVDYRTHVGINYDTQSADDGALFQTSQLRLTMYEAGSGVPRRFAFAVGTDSKQNTKRMLGATGTLGGERRMVSVQRSEKLMDWPCPDLHGENIVRVVLLTPGIFEAGWKPGPKGLGKGVEVLAAAVSRYTPVSGWSFDRNNWGPKPTRYMAPAGSVYWLKISSEAAQWAQNHHFQSICDDAQDRLDGFGLIAVGRK